MSGRYFWMELFFDVLGCFMENSPLPLKRHTIQLYSHFKHPSSIWISSNPSSTRLWRTGFLSVSYNQPISAKWNIYIIFLEICGKIKILNHKSFVHHASNVVLVMINLTFQSMKLGMIPRETIPIITKKRFMTVTLLLPLPLPSPLSLSLSSPSPSLSLPSPSLPCSFSYNHKRCTTFSHQIMERKYHSEGAKCRTHNMEWHHFFINYRVAAEGKKADSSVHILSTHKQQ
jgi:hypothetical protein